MSSGSPECRKVRDPSTCDAEQVRKCHGDAETHTCEPAGCEGKADPEECSPEQIRECHGDSAEHVCAEE